MSDQEVPPLDDFEDEIKNIQYNKPKDYGGEDYTKIDAKYLDEESQKKQIKQIQKKVQQISKNIEKQKPKSDYAGFKKGFLSGGNTNSNKEKKVTQVKAPTKKTNPLEFKQVQQAMKMNNYLDSTRSQWMTDNFLQNVTSNEKVNKLFTNPEYMKAIDLFKTNPKQAMMKYGQNKQFMEGFQQFCKMMGMQFQSLAQKPSK